MMDSLSPPGPRSTWLVVTTILFFATAVFAQQENFHQFTRPSKATNGARIPAGSTYQITWIADSVMYPGTVVFLLDGGYTTGSLKTTRTIGSIDAFAAKFDWYVNETLGTLPIYRIGMYWEKDPFFFQESVPFEIVPVATSTASVSGSSSTSSASIVASSTLALDAPTPSSSQTGLVGDKVEGQSSNPGSGSVPIAAPVALGVVLGLVVLAGLGWFWWRRKENQPKKMTRLEEIVPELGKDYKDKESHDGSFGELPAYERSVEVSGHDGPFRELPVHERPVEVSGEGTTRRVELE